METVTRRKVRMDELPEVVQRLSKEPISPEVVARRRQLTAEIRKIRAEMEPLEEDIKALIRREQGEGRIG